MSVADDGVGGAAADRGSGLAGLADRVAARGRHSTSTAAGHRTKLTAELPCGRDRRGPGPAARGTRPALRRRRARGRGLRATRRAWPTVVGPQTGSGRGSTSGCRRRTPTRGPGRPREIKARASRDRRTAAVPAHRDRPRVDLVGPRRVRLPAEGPGARRGRVPGRGRPGGPRWVGAGPAGRRLRWSRRRWAVPGAPDRARATRCSS